ncbi:hypothetical protein BTVI_58107 [Pitangus sulphuratus]|nr:hypothetical protein BTVI_58107 [Pitangus sulphuratus]
MELTAGNSTVESLWVRIKGQTNNVDVIIGIRYRPPSQDDDANELIFEELQDTSKATALVLMGDIAGSTWARKLKKNLDALLDLLLANRVDLVSEVQIGGHLGHSDHKAIKFKISVDRRKSGRKTSTLDMRKTDFRVLRELKGKMEDPGNYRPVSLTSMPAKVMEKIILGTSGKHMKDNTVFGHTQQSFLRGKSCLSNLISFYDKDPSEQNVRPTADKHIMQWVSKELYDHTYIDPKFESFP